MRKNDALKTCQKSKFLRKKIWRNALALKRKKVQGIFVKTFGIIVFSCIWSTNPCLISYKLFFLGDKRFLSEFLRKWGWFHRHNERFPKYLGQNLKFQKTETGFCRWKSTDNSDINIFLSLENLCTFLLAKEKTWQHIFNTNNELSRNRTEKTNYGIQNKSKLTV